MAAWIGTACSNVRNAVGQDPTLLGTASGPRCLGLAHGCDAIDNPHVCTSSRHPSVSGSGPLWKLPVQDASRVGSVWKATSASGATRATIHRRRLDAAQGERLLRHGVRRPIGCGPAPCAFRPSAAPCASACVRINARCFISAGCDRPVVCGFRRRGLFFSSMTLNDHGAQLESGCYGFLPSMGKEDIASNKCLSHGSMPALGLTRIDVPGSR